MGDLLNRPAMNVLGYSTTAAIFAATLGLLLTSLK